MSNAGNTRPWLVAGGLALALAAILLVGMPPSRRDPKGGRQPESSHVVARATRPGPVEEARRLLSQARLPERGESGDPRWGALLQRLAESAPGEAIALAVEHEPKHGDDLLAGGLFGGWLDREPAAARAWFDDVTDEPLRLKLLPVLISQLASGAPDEALELAAGLPGSTGGRVPARWESSDELGGQPRERAYASVFREWAAGDPAAAAARAVALPDAGHRLLAVQEVAAAWVMKAPEDALAWARTLPPGGGREAAMEGLMAEWAACAPAEAARHAAGLDDAAERAQWIEPLATGWSATDPLAALAWAGGLTEEDEQITATRGVLAGVMERAPDEAADLLLEIPSGVLRREAMNLVLVKWAAEDPAAVSHWLEALEDPAAREEARAVTEGR